MEIIPRTTEVQHLRCGKCGRPFAKLQGSVIIIESVHGGERHINVVSTAELCALARGLLAEAPVSGKTASGTSTMSPCGLFGITGQE